MSAVLAPIVASLGAVESADGAIQTEPFLVACRLVLPVFDKMGVAFAAAKSDVSGNIERLAKRAPDHAALFDICLLYTSPSPRDATLSRMPSSA